MIFVVEEYCIGRDSYIVEAKSRSEARSKFIDGDFKNFGNSTEILEHTKIIVRKPTDKEKEDRLYVRAVNDMNVVNTPYNYKPKKKRGRPKKNES